MIGTRSVYPLEVLVPAWTKFRKVPSFNTEPKFSTSGTKNTIVGTKPYNSIVLNLVLTC